MKTWLVQYAAALDVGANLETIRRLVCRAVEEEGRSWEDTPRLFVLPEGAMHDFGSPDLPLGPVAERLDGPFVSSLAALARECDATIVAGMFERSDEPDRPYNTLAVVEASGELVASYRKVHLFDSFGYRESDRLSPGGGAPVVVPVADLTLGLMTCYDLRFPELARDLVDAGADTLVVPAAWLPGPLKDDHWTTLLRARAIENTSYVVAAGQAAPSYVGHSMIVDPEGVVVAAAGRGEEVVSAKIDRAMIDETRRRNPSLANRRLHRSH